MTTVRAATYEVLRQAGVGRIFGNPGTTEIPFLTELPDDLEFVLALHESSAVGMAIGAALAEDAVQLVNLHTSPGLGNAVGAIASAREARAPVVVMVGQQDRRHIAHAPFLTGRLRGMAGEYPVWTVQPDRAEDVPATLARAIHESKTHAAPVLVIVPMDDWDETADDDLPAAARRVSRGELEPAPAAIDEVASLLEGSSAPALVVGARCRSQVDWDALERLAERLECPVWFEPFGSLAAFPEDHRLFAGDLSAERARIREQLSGNDVVLVVGAPAFRYFLYESGPVLEESSELVVVSDDPAEVHRSPAELSILAAPAAFCRQLAQRLAQRPQGPAPDPPPAAPAPDPDAELTSATVVAELAARLPAGVSIVEESSTGRAALRRQVPATRPLGFVSEPIGGLGYALPVSVGLRMADPSRPVLALIGDGASLYSIQALWSAAEYGVGVVVVILTNGGYSVMSHLSDQRGGSRPWPDFDVSTAKLAEGFGCPSVRVSTYAELVEALDRELEDLADRSAPALIEVRVASDAELDL